MKTVKEIGQLFSLLAQMDFYQKYGVKKVGVFGSFARGEAFNDIDLFIEEDLDYRQVEDMKQALETQTGIAFDILIKKNAEPVILHRAFKEMLHATTH